MTAVRMTKNLHTKPKIIVDIQVEFPKWNAAIPDLTPRVKAAVEEAILAAGFPEACEVCVLLTNDEEVKTLNKDFRGQDKATNVLSFPGLEPHELKKIMHTGLVDPDPDGDPQYLGDIALGYETIAKEAIEQNKTLLNHLTHLVIHGTLHLLGHDHMVDKEAEEMEALEAEILKNKFEIANPYK